MAPSHLELVLAQRDEKNSTSANASESKTEDPHYLTWIIVGVAIVATVLLGAVAYFVVDRIRHRQYREACQRDPYLTRKEFARRRKLNAVERLEEEELQRTIMIRKSLASRTSKSTSQVDEDEVESLRAGGLRRDWKELEAGIRKDEAPSMEQHPFVDVQLRGSAELPRRGRSRSASTKLPLLSEPVPQLPRLPSFDPLSADWSLRPANPQPAYVGHHGRSVSDSRLP